MNSLPPTLAALQWIFIMAEVNKEVFALLEKESSLIKPHSLEMSATKGEITPDNVKLSKNHDEIQL